MVCSPGQTEKPSSTVDFCTAFHSVMRNRRKSWNVKTVYNYDSFKIATKFLLILSKIGLSVPGKCPLPHYLLFMGASGGICQTMIVAVICLDKQFLIFWLSDFCSGSGFMCSNGAHLSPSVLDKTCLEAKMYVVAVGLSAFQNLSEHSEVWEHLKGHQCLD